MRAAALQKEKAWRPGCRHGSPGHKDWQVCNLWVRLCGVWCGVCCVVWCCGGVACAVRCGGVVVWCGVWYVVCGEM